MIILKEQAMKTQIAAYGYSELREQYKQNMLIALAIASIIVGELAAGFRLLDLANNLPKSNEFYDHVIFLDHLPPPPSLDPSHTMIHVDAVCQNLEKGIPVPVPDGEVMPEKEFASQIDLSREADRLAAEFDKERTGKTLVDAVITDPEPSPTDFRSVEQFPQMVTKVSPEYPALAIKTGIEGFVVVQILVDTNGKVRKAHVLKSDCQIFEKAAVDAAMRTTFTPAIMNGHPVMFWMTIPFKFRLSR